MPEREGEKKRTEELDINVCICVLLICFVYFRFNEDDV